MSETSYHLPKGQLTRMAIVDAALRLASQVGLEGLSIGAVAELMSMSKSGVFAHFGSREGLQQAVITAYHHQFEATVFQPAMQEPRGLPRLQALMNRWLTQLDQEIDSGCIYISGATEFDDRSGPVRDTLTESVSIWLTALRRAVQQAIDAGHLRADTDPRQLAFQLHGLALALHFEGRFLRDGQAMALTRQCMNDVIDRHRTSTPSLET
jgi:AcrR family transcriptional regulator